MSLSFSSKRTTEIPFAGIRKVLEKAVRLEQERIKVINFGIGRPNFDTPSHIKKAAAKALDEGAVHYTHNAGIPELRNALSKKILEDKGISYDPETEIMVTAGGQEAIYLSLQALIEPGDEILVPDPGFGPFFHSIKLAGGTAISIPLLEYENFAPNLERCQTLLTDRTRGIIVNSPHNPSGGVMDEKQLKAICDFAIHNNLIVFSDEAYDRILYPGHEFLSIAAFPGMKNRTIIWGSLSKTYAMTGWRIGYIAAHAELITGAVKVQQNLMLCLCSFAQAGAVAALTGPQDCVDEMVSKFYERRQVILDGIDAAPGLTNPTIPGGAFYVFARHDTADMNSETFADYLMDKVGVATVPGTTFGKNGEGYLRISYAMSLADCKEGVERVIGAMRELSGS